MDQGDEQRAEQGLQAQRQAGIGAGLGIELQRPGGAEAVGLRLAASSTPIQPVIVGDERAALAASAALGDAGFFVPAIRPPTVPTGSSRLRFTFSAAHSDGDLERLLAAISMLVRRGLLP